MKFKNTVKDFGDEWEKFDNEKLETKQLNKIFNSYFHIFPKKKFSKKNIGIDLGSGSGRWAKFVAPKGKRLYLLEPSKKAIKVSQNKLNSITATLILNSNHFL